MHSPLVRRDGGATGVWFWGVDLSEMVDQHKVIFMHSDGVDYIVSEYFAKTAFM